jgi:fatty-acyl-CoA synthase
MLHPSVHARTHPGKVAYQMAESGETLTYRDLEDRSNQAAHVFRSLGLNPGDHIALMMENCLTFLEICWAAQRSGLYYTAISRYLTEGEIAYILEDCGAKAFIISPAALSATRTIAESKPAGLSLFICKGTAPGFRSWEDATAAHPANPIADETFGWDMLYSSGTTGRPKGVLRPFTPQSIGTPTALLKVLCMERFGLSEDSIYLSPAPLYHSAPLRFSMMSAALGGTAIIMERFDAEEFLRLVEKHRVTHAQLVPTMFIRMLKLPDAARLRYSTASLQRAIHAAAPCPVEVKRRMIEWWGPILLEYYGGTESIGITIVDSPEWLKFPGTVGRAAYGTLKIAGEDGTEMPRGTPGTVYFADSPKFAYHNDPEKTAKAYNKRGWATLGDIGTVNSEGYLFLIDRAANMIISGGVNIYPQECEDVLIGHPAVADVAVFGIPDEEMGEQVKAVVLPKDGTETGPELEAELIAFCRARLSPIKCPKSVDFVSEFPRTPTGKLLKRLLRDKYWPKT